MEPLTKEEGLTPFGKSLEIASLDLNYFQSFNPYTLGSINSIAYSSYFFI